MRTTDDSVNQVHIHLLLKKRRLASFTEAPYISMTYINYDISTLHGAQRVKERRNLKNTRAAEKQFVLALQRSKTADDYASWERNFLLERCKEDRTAIAYNDFCYIFGHNGACITLFPLPDWFGKRKHFDGKQRIRDYKKYTKMISSLYDAELECG